jgi:hypothetical protein
MDRSDWGVFFDKNGVFELPPIPRLGGSLCRRWPRMPFDDDWLVVHQTFFGPRAIGAKSIDLISSSASIFCTSVYLPS